MMKRVWLALLLCVPLSAQEAPKTKSEADAAMEMYLEAAKPVAEHKRLAELVGPWKVSTKLWFGPGEPMTTTGTGNGKMILGGRFLQLDTTVHGGMAGEAMSLFGFDRRTNDYTMIGLDTMGTYWITAAGKYDEAKKGVVLAGSYLQPPANSEQKYHFVWTTPSAREHLLTLYFSMDGKDVRVAETRLERK